jgi:hypothetical protein
MAIDGPLKSMGQRGRDRLWEMCRPGQSRYKLSVAVVEISVMPQPDRWLPRCNYLATFRRKSH